MNVLFTGSRELGGATSLKLAGRAAVTEISALKPGTDTIIHGGARGFDSLVDFIAKSRGFEPRVITPNYRLWPGRIAPIKRDEEMLRMSDRVVAFWNGVSNGTKATVNFAVDEKKPVRLYTIKNTGLHVESLEVLLR